MPLDVFITIDTEVWPHHRGWREDGLRQDIDRDIYGVTPGGEFGVRYQMDVLDRYGLRAVFFVESLFALAVGVEPLSALVQEIQSRGHDVQLHLHAEWLKWLDPSPLPGRRGTHLHEFSEAEQTALLEAGRANLEAAGARNVCAFRAGNYGGNFDTLRALARLGIRFDTTLNPCYLSGACKLQTAAPVYQPVQLCGVHEFPVSVFQDWPGHYRHAQLCSCSSSEMHGALTQAWQRGWTSFVIVSHSFEMIGRRKQTAIPPQPDGIVAARFERLCRFLDRHRDRFRTATFGDLVPTQTPEPTARPLRSRVHRTLGRMAGQFVRRITCPQ